MTKIMTLSGRKRVIRLSKNKVFDRLAEAKNKSSP